MKPSDALRFLAALAAGVLVLALVAVRVVSHGPRVSHPAAPAPPAAPPAASTEPCDQGPKDAALANAASLSTLSWAPFRDRPETGWETYVPLIAREIGSACPPQSPGFAARLAAWQKAHGLRADGVMSEAAFIRLQAELELRRPFVRLNRTGACPAPPPQDRLAVARPAETYGGMTIRLRPGALAAYRAMVAAAREQDPRIAADPKLLTLFSGFRGPADEAGRCASPGGCGGVARASCSAHRTGLALDLDLGAAPGLRLDSADDANRLYLSRTPAYRWLVANADRYGFVNYPFEPWHWEWTGEPLEAQAPAP